MDFNLKKFPAEYLLISDQKTPQYLFVTDSLNKGFKINYSRLINDAVVKSDSGAVKITGDILPTFSDVNKRYSFTTGATSRVLKWTNPSNAQVVSFTFGAYKQCSIFWDGNSKSWVKEDEVELQRGVDGKTIEEYNVSLASGYVAKSLVFFNGEIWEAMTDALVGQSPATNPEKWKVVFKGSLIAEGSNFEKLSFTDVTTKGYYTTAGVLTTANSTYLTPFLPCDENDTIEAMTRTRSDALAIALFDQNQTYVRGVIGNASGSLTTRTTKVLNNEHYYRVSTTVNSDPADKIDTYAKRIIQGDEGAETVEFASNKIDKLNVRSNIVTTEKAVVDYITDQNIPAIKVALNGFIPEKITPVTLDIQSMLVQGGIDASGVSTVNSARIRTDAFLPYNKVEVTTNGTADYSIYFYSFDGTYISETGWITSVGVREHTVVTSAKLRIQFKNKAGTALTPSEFSTLNIQVKAVESQISQLASKNDVKIGSASSVPLNLASKIKVVSNWKVEKMTHDGNLQVDENGRFYMPYYATNDNFIETPSAAGVSSRMSFWEICDPNSITYLEMMKRGETIGSDTVSSSSSPYTPAIFINTVNKNHLLYLASAVLSSDSDGWRMIGRYWDKTTKVWVEDLLRKCTLTYTYSGGSKTVQFSEIGIQQMVFDQDGRTIDTTGFQMFMGRWKKYNNEYYSFFGTINNKTNGYIVKTSDGIVYTVVSPAPGNRTNVWEGAIEIHGDKLFCIMRGSSQMWVYDLVLKTWETVSNVITNDVAQRVAMHKKDNYIYIFHNISNVGSTGWVTIRNNVRILKIDPKTYAIVAKQEFATPFGFHYCGFVDYMTLTYCYMTQDLRLLNPTDPKTNISVIAWEDLIKI